MSTREEWNVRTKATLEAMYGRDMYPQLLPDGIYSPGIGHTGSPWPAGTGHDYCWAPWQCISCGCYKQGPCDAHKNIARIAGWKP